MFDIAALVTVHAETTIAGPTFASAEISIRHAEAAGFSVERRIGFDRPQAGVLEYFDKPVFSKWTKTEHDYGDQGATRNDLSLLSNARCLAFLDADDLWSENWLTEASKTLYAAEKRGEKAIAHPELNWFFEGHNSIFIQTPQDDPLFTPEFFAFSNYYDALCMAPRQAHIDFPYASRDLIAGYALEDWQWNIETMAAGWRHISVKNTIIFKRRQKISQTVKASQASAVIRNHEPLRIDRIRKLGNV